MTILCFVIALVGYAFFEVLNFPEYFLITYAIFVIGGMIFIILNKISDKMDELIKAIKELKNK